MRHDLGLDGVDRLRGAPSCRRIRIGGAQVLPRRGRSIVASRAPRCRRRSSSRGSLAAFSASWMMASITGWNAGGRTSRRRASPPRTAPWLPIRPSARRPAVPATTRSSWLSAISSSCGLSTYSLLMKPTRAAPIGPMKGTPESVSAAEAATMADDVGIVLQIVRQHGDDHLRVAAPAVGEQRADRPVDQARDQRLASRSGGLRA